MKSFDTWKGCISSTAGSLVTNSLNEINLGGGNIKVDGFNSSQIGSISSLNSTIGSLASTAVTYGLTGEATFNVLNISDFGAQGSSGLLEVTLGGKKGFSSRIGTGGADVSRGSLMTALAGINNLKMNEKIKKAAANNNMENAATALRMQYGFGDEKQMKQLDDILNGDAVLKAGTGNGDAQTVMENGQRTVYLNNYKENMTREEKLAMGITLGHEAYRDGITGTKIEQINETRDAVRHHTEMLNRVKNDSAYTKVMQDVINHNDNLKLDLMFASLGQDAFNSYIDGMYDSSSDYWKLVMEADGNSHLDYDGKKTLSIEYLDNNGEVISTATPEKQNMDGVGMAESLVKILGEDRAREILSKNGKTLDSMDDVSITVLSSVLGVSENNVVKMLNNIDSSALDKLYKVNETKFLGETLLNSSGTYYNGKTWTNDKNGKSVDRFTLDGINIVDGKVDGNIMAEVNADGRYLYSTVNAYVFRDPESWKSATSTDG